jgi:hypothetical protein
MDQVKNAVIQAINPSQARTPQISSADLIQTQMSPLIEKITEVANEISTEAPVATPTPAENPTATAEAKTTRLAK